MYIFANFTHLRYHYPLNHLTPTKNLGGCQNKSATVSFPDPFLARLRRALRKMGLAPQDYHNTASGLYRRILRNNFKKSIERLKALSVLNKMAKSVFA